MIYYIADMHLGHQNVLRFDARPFESVEDMDETIIRNWNARVTDEDTVYVLGDAFWKNEAGSVAIFSRLKGHKHLIRGNHDRVHGKLGKLWESIEHYAEITDGKTQVVMCHYPIPFYNGQHRGSVMLHGHIHNSRESMILERWKKELHRKKIPTQMVNVGCMLPHMNYTPRSLEELLVSTLQKQRWGDGNATMDKNDYGTFLEKVKPLTDQIATLRDLAYAQYAEITNEILADFISEEREIERILDGLVGYLDDPRFLELSKKICGHIFERYPGLVCDFVNYYKTHYAEK